MRGHQPWHQWTCVSKLRVIDTNQIQSKAQQPDKILNHRDLGIWLEIWLGWHKTHEKLFIWVHWKSTGRRVVHGENDCWLHVLSVFYFISPSWKKNLLQTWGLSDASKLLAVLVHGWWSSSRVERCLLWLGGVDSPSVFFCLGFT